MVTVKLKQSSESFLKFIHWACDEAKIAIVTLTEKNLLMLFLKTVPLLILQEVQ